MKIDKTVLALGIASFAPLAVYAVKKVIRKRTKKSLSSEFEIDKDTEWVLECLDDMVADIKQTHKQQDEQEKRLARLEERIDNVNIRLDNLMGGK